MTPVTLWHNPRCSKSREALLLLEENGVSAEIVLYLDTAPDRAEIKALLQKLSLGARELMRTKEALYKELGLNEVTDEEQLIDAMASHPKLIERPIAIKGDKAIIGRPPQNIITFLK